MTAPGRAGASRSVRAALALACAAVAGCGGDDPAPPPEAGEQASRFELVEPAHQGVGEIRAGSIASQADCEDWRAGTLAEQKATIIDLRGVATPQRDPSAESSLSDERAFEVLQNFCRQDFADNFELYKLYTHAAAFAPLDR